MSPSLVKAQSRRLLPKANPVVIALEKVCHPQRISCNRETVREICADRYLKKDVAQHRAAAVAALNYHFLLSDFHRRQLEHSDEFRALNDTAQRSGFELNLISKPTVCNVDTQPCDCSGSCGDRR